MSKGKYPITSQKEIRRQFWADHPQLPRKKVRNYAGTGSMYPTDTRCAFVDYIDYLCRGGMISSALAERVTL